ncbi:amino acid ABC transporter substrate-binding protein [Vagococcus elongatus]|uniref:Amino acid ABC transporter substrate-binding protein n=1 Tax=Vagococcus elongatus TaxID=180344 RepID=A0A430AXA4_9ENTE|nr:amino acid ABC transporter substrate-binding protein [Vagococcus elongatus]RSU12701.1 amino acid ABC transporter substrate-binding protein [Vagococcus elongatus]
MKKKNIVWTLVLGAALLLAVGCGGSDKKEGGKKEKLTDWAEIEAAGKIVVGVDDTFVPMGFRDENNELVGFDIDLANAVGEKLDIEVEFQPVDWSMKESELENGTIDAIWNGYTVTEEREKKVAFSNYYLINEQDIVSMKKDNVQNFSEMKDKVLGAQEGSSGAESIENFPELLKDIIKDQEPILYPTFTEAFLDLEAGRIQGLVIDKVFAEYYIAQQDNSEDYVVAPSEFEQENFAVGLRKGDKETLKKINGALKDLYDEGKSKEISEKWFGEDRILPQ